MSFYPTLDADHLLERIATKVPAELRPNIVVIGSIAAAWAFRDISGTGAVATKDIDLLLSPAMAATAAAATLGHRLLADGWSPHYPRGFGPGNGETPTDQLPALRLSPPGETEGWFVELLAVPRAGQTTRKAWTRFETNVGHFALPSFRFMPIAVEAPDESPFGLRIARPANMALAHLLEHADPDKTPIQSVQGTPPRFVKDVGRAIALWWLANQQSPMAAGTWRDAWRSCLNRLHPESEGATWLAAHQGLTCVSDYRREAHELAVRGVLAPHQTTLDAFQRAYDGLLELIEAS